jgi:hypothetical protein
LRPNILVVVAIVILRSTDSTMSGTPDEKQPMAAGLMKDSVMDNNSAEQNVDRYNMQLPNTSVFSVIGNEYVQHHEDPQPRQRQRSHACCGCRCDIRHAVLVIDIINVSLHGLNLFYFLVLYPFDSNITVFDTDDIYREGHLNWANDMVGLVFAAIGTIFIGVGIYGAANFSQSAIIVGGLWWVIESLRQFVIRNWGVAILYMAYFITHAVFYYEMKSGKMSRQTYPHGKRCCDSCCDC